MKREPKEKKCKYCKGAFMQYRSTQVVCSTTCAISYTKIKNQEKLLKEARKKKKEWYDNNLSVQELANKVQVTFNTFIRNRDRGKRCISCPTILNGKFDAGHYHNANNHWNVRFDERNVHGQCVKCNRDMHGNLIEYRKSLVLILGEEELSKLDSIAKEARHFTRSELKELDSHYKSLNKL